MYPFKTEQSYPYNQWYVAAWSNEIKTELSTRKILGVSLALYRNREEKVVAMLDSCPHRRFPLSQGKLLGDAVQCRYHGFTFRSSGDCIAIPAQERVPAGYKVRTYPTVEKWEWVWIWMGDPELADESLIPNHSAVKDGDAAWTPVIGGVETLQARYALFHENLLDLSHLSFLHEATIGSSGVATTQLELEEKEDHLQIARYIRSDSVENLPLAKALNMQGLVDRTMIQQFFAPSLHVTGSAFSSAQIGGEQPGKEFGSFRVIHAITPESPYSTHYFWAFTRNFLLEDGEIGDRMKAPIYAALKEDIFASEAIEKNLSAGARASDDIHCRADAAAIRGRTMMENLIVKEENARRPALGAVTA